tara:strand:- start:2565 stop:4073 length:1509 start_codon:yes stop_codon:yes gene_type:complete
MKILFLLFDSLNLRMLNSYGGKYFETKNFNRLAKKSIQFNNHYVGSMPCMPARRDMHSGRLNFLHRSWGPLEPFDNSFPEILRNNRIYSHLVTDHYHYFEDGGATYHNRFNSWDFIRGQESDPWKAMVQPPLEKFKEKFHKSQLNTNNRESGHYRYAVNSEFIKEEKDFPSVKCFNSALDFLKINKDEDDWFLQLETFDPHEPFFAPQRFREKFKTNYRGPRLDWPQYDKVKETDDEVAELKANYYALIGLCDYLLGKILDYFDEQNLWDNTALILTTDHGFMLGEHDWWAKNRMPMYNEIAHIPLFIYHPEYKQYVGESRSAVTQNIDLMPTFLDMNNLNIPKEVKGKSLLDLLKKDSDIYTALYGYWGGGINITDGSYTYFHYPDNFDQTSQDKYQYTLMPTHMRQFFSNEELRTIKIQKPFAFTKDIPVMKINRIQRKTDEGFKSLEDTKSALYNIIKDPGQLNPLQDQHLIIKYKDKMINSIKDNDPPKELLANYFNI